VKRSNHITTVSPFELDRSISRTARVFEMVRTTGDYLTVGVQLDGIECHGRGARDFK
jgi:hypothetical protein